MHPQIVLDGHVWSLEEAEAYYWATIDDPAATEAERIQAADHLERAETLTRELIAAPAAGEPQLHPEAEAEPEAAI